MWDEESIYRETPLPVGELKGVFQLSKDAFQHTREALISFRLAGIQDGGHEGIVFLAGREFIDKTVYLTAIVPEAEHSAQRVIVSKESYAKVARTARATGLGVLCQVHSHPGKDTRHSEGDDHLIILPFEGMLSLVAPNYGVSLRSIKDFGVHQFQNGSWVFCNQASVNRNLILVPSNLI